MVRPSDPFWIHVEELDDGHLRCIFCECRFAAGISISRVKSHLAGVEGRGIKICGQVPRDVREEAFQAIREKPKSSNEVSHTASTSSGKPNDEVLEMIERRIRKLEMDKMKDIETLQVENEELRQKNFLLAEQREVLNKKMLEGKLELEKLKRFLRQRKDFSSELLGNVLHETTGDVWQESDPVDQAPGRTQVAVDDVLMNEVESVGTEFVQPVVRGSSRDDPQHNDGQTRRDDLPTTTELVGQAFEGNKAASPKTTEVVSQASEEHTEDFWSPFMGNDLPRPSVGIYGMGGVGEGEIDLTMEWMDDIRSGSLGIDDDLLSPSVGIYGMGGVGEGESDWTMMMGGGL